MMGLAGDAKNTGSLIVNSDEKAPAQMEQANDPRAGLRNAAQQIMQSLDEANRDSFMSALEAFVNMTVSLKMMERQNQDQQPTMENLRPGGF